MIAKKNSNVDLERKKASLFTIGLLAAGSFTLAAFTYQSPTSIEEQKNTVASKDISYMVEENVKKKVDVKPVVIKQKTQDTKQQNQTTVKAQVLANDKSSVVKNTKQKVETGVGMANPPEDIGDGFIVVEDLDGEIIEFVDKEAAFITGPAGMMKFIQENVEYPSFDLNQGVQGKVQLTFVVEKDGSISNVTVEKGVSKAIDREAKRLIRSFPKWIPGELGAKPVRTKVRLPIVFTAE